MNKNNKKYKTMKTLLKKMRIVTMCTILFIGFLAVNGQNKFTFPDSIYQGGQVIDTTRIIDFDAVESNDQMSNNIATAIRNYYYVIDIWNADADKRAFQQVASTKWTWDVIDSLLYGKLNNIDSNIVGMWEVLHSGWIYNSFYYKEFVCRSNHIQYGFELLDTVQFLSGRQILTGVLLDTNNNIGWVRIESNNYHPNVNLIFKKQD